MEHSLPLEVNPWRRAAVLAAALALFELVALVAAGIALFGVPLVHHVQDAALKHELAAAQPRPQPSPVGRPRLTRTETSVLVLNGNGSAGAASTAASSLRARGYTIGGVGNAPRSDYATTIVMYRPGFRPEAARLARDLHLRAVGPLDGLKVRDLMGAHLAVVLGR